MIKIVVIYGILWLSLSSCITLVQIPLIEPPEITLPPGDQKIVFVSRFDTTQLSFSKDKITAVYRESYSSFIEGLEAGFETNERLSLVVSDTVIAGRWFTEETPDFNDSDHVPYLISDLQPDYLLTLDALLLKRDQDQQVVDYGDGISTITYYYLIGSAALALFDAESRVVDKMLMQDEVPIENDIRYGLGSHVGKYREIATPLCYDLGFDYALMFDDFKYTEDRYMYSGKIFQVAVESAKNGNWEDAKQQLLPYTQDPKDKYARQAASNMGVVEEALGNQNEALIWYTKAGSYMINDLYPE